MRRFIYVFLSAAISLFVWSGCGGTNSDDSKLPEGEQEFEVDQGTVTITSMKVLVQEIVFDGDGPNGSKSVSRSGTFDIAMIEGTSDPEYPVIEMAEGTWGSTYLGVEIDDDVDGRDSIELEGVYRGDDGAQDFRFLFNSGEVFEPDFPSELTLEEKLEVDIAKAFHPSQWFPNDIQLDNADVDDEGYITLSESSNTSKYNRMANALDRSTQNVDWKTFQ